jgi:transposase
MKAIHGGKAKHDTIDAHKIAVLLRGGMRPQAYVYPAEMRATRDLLRRRMHLMRQRAALLAHIHNTKSQDNRPAIPKKLAYKAHRGGVAERFPDPAVQKSIEVDLTLIDSDDRPLTDLELALVQTAKAHEAQTFYRLRSIPGVGKILALVLLYEIHDIHRFPRGRSSSPVAGWSSVRKKPPASATGPPARRSAMPPSNGPSRKPPYSACGTIRQGRRTSPASSASMARAKP